MLLMTWLPSFSRMTCSSSPMKCRSDRCQRWLNPTLQLFGSEYEAAPKLGEIKRAVTQPCAKAFGAEAEKPIKTARPEIRTRTPFETRIKIARLVWFFVD